jgi:glycolate oxidase iron-sulfur subunit
MANQLLERKMNNVAATGASVIVTGNPGCMMQIAMGMRERGLPMEVKHPVELLDEAYRIGGLYALPTRNKQANQKRQQSLLLGIGAGIAVSLFLLLRGKRHND